MAYSRDDVLALPGAEVVGGNIIQGTLADRTFVGKINDEGVFYITPEGEARLAALSAAPAPAAPAVTESVANDVQAVLDANASATVEDLQAAEDELSAAISKKK